MSRAAPTADGPLLHLGCGLIAPAEWVNVDASPNARLARHPRLKRLLGKLRLVPRSQLEIDWPKNVIVSDLRKRLPFRDGEFAAVFSSHALEHLYRDDALHLLRESYRVLRPGGPCRTLVPDARAIIREYLGEASLNLYDQQTENSLADDPCRRMITRLHLRPEAPARGPLLYRMYQAVTDFHWHKWMYDGPSLVRLMTEAGFRDCAERGMHETSIPHIDKVEMPGRVLEGNGVIVEGHKP